jgi:hypothetical protein
VGFWPGTALPCLVVYAHRGLANTPRCVKPPPPKPEPQPQPQPQPQHIYAPWGFGPRHLGERPPVLGFASPVSSVSHYHPPRLVGRKRKWQCKRSASALWRMGVLGPSAGGSTPPPPPACNVPPRGIRGALPRPNWVLRLTTAWGWLGGTLLAAGWGPSGKPRGMGPHEAWHGAWHGGAWGLAWEKETGARRQLLFAALALAGQQPTTHWHCHQSTPSLLIYLLSIPPAY